MPNASIQHKAEAGQLLIVPTHSGSHQALIFRNDQREILMAGPIKNASTIALLVRMMRHSRRDSDVSDSESPYPYEKC